MRGFGHLRGVVALLAALAPGAVGLGVLTAVARASPIATYKAVALPIPGFPGTGVPGAGAVIEATAKVSGTEYGGSPPPLVGLKVYGPPGSVIHPQGFATCASAVLEQVGPGRCPKRSVAGPQGSARGTVTFGGERVPETVSLQLFFAPGGGLTAFIDGTSPVLVEILADARLILPSSSHGPELTGEIPLIETVPGALDASFEEGTVIAGAAYRRGGRTIPYITLPKACQGEGWPTKADFEFLGGIESEATYTIPCPRK